MCVAKTPKIKSDPADQKDPPIIRNPILDGMLGNIAALRGGRNALRIDLLNPLSIPVGGGTGLGGGGGGSGGGSPSAGGGGSSAPSGGGSFGTGSGSGSSSGSGFNLTKQL